MTTEQKAEMRRLRASGVTLQKIADQFGVTRECVRQNTISIGGTGYHKTAVHSCIYPNLAKWMDDNQCSFTDFAVLIDSNNKSVQRWLTGKNAPSKTVIDRMRAVTGMSYEALFAQEEPHAD